MTGPDETTKILLCSCEDSMPIDLDAVRAGCKGAKITTARQACMAEFGKFTHLAGSGRLTVACTQQQPLFAEVADDEGLGAAISYVNVRETAGWSSEARNAGAKMAALLAAAHDTDPPVRAFTLESNGVALIYGHGQPAIDVAMRLKDRLDITVLITGQVEATPPRNADFPIRRGRIKTITGHIGAFDVTIDAYAEPAPSSRGSFVWGQARNGAQSKADLVIDVTGGTTLLTAPEFRDGYLRADPADRTAVAELCFKAADLVGTFDKPRYIKFDPDLCAHSRSRITGCTRCLDLCPAGAIAPSGNHVAIDPAICGGCGQCAAACPTGAASYDLPASDLLMRRLRTMLAAYHAAGGTSPLLLVHDREHGEALIDAAARFGDGLPARVVPFAVNEVTQVGLEWAAAAFVHGATGVRFLNRAKPRHDIAGLNQTIATAGQLLTALGWPAGSVAGIETDDPDQLVASLREAGTGVASPRPSQFLAMGGKRDVMKLALRELHRAAPAPVDTVLLPAGAAFGRIVVDTKGCTLCLSCVSACPAGALGDAADHPLLKFDESLCVQCGLCRATCPEKVITLEPRIDFPSFEAGWQTVKEEEPFCCTRCNKAFGVKSTIERVIAKLEGSGHWMFQGKGTSRIELLKLCEDCRVIAATDASLDPYGAPPRPLVKTTEDYLKEREAREKAMLDKIDKGEV